MANTATENPEPHSDFKGESRIPKVDGDYPMKVLYCGGMNLADCAIIFLVCSKLVIVWNQANRPLITQINCCVNMFLCVEGNVSNLCPVFAH